MVKVELITNLPKTYLINLPKDGKIRRLRVRFNYNRVGRYYTVSITDVNDNEILVDNVPLVRCEGNKRIYGILDQLFYLGIDSPIIAKTSRTADDSPTINSLVDCFTLFWG